MYERTRDKEGKKHWKKTASENVLPIACNLSHACFNCLSAFPIKRKTLYLSITQCFTNVSTQKTTGKQTTALLMCVKYNIMCSKFNFFARFYKTCSLNMS